VYCISRFRYITTTHTTLFPRLTTCPDSFGVSVRMVTHQAFIIGRTHSGISCHSFSRRNYSPVCSVFDYPELFVRYYSFWKRRNRLSRPPECRITIFGIKASLWNRTDYLLSALNIFLGNFASGNDYWSELVSTTPLLSIGLVCPTYSDGVVLHDTPVLAQAERRPRSFSPRLFTACVHLTTPQSTSHTRQVLLKRLVKIIILSS